jgi:hypothetical protein
LKPSPLPARLLDGDRNQRSASETYYTTWAATPPTEEQMAALLVEQYEPERGESLGYYGMAVADVAGTQIPERARGDDANQDDEGEDVSERAHRG